MYFIKYIECAFIHFLIALNDVFNRKFIEIRRQNDEFEFKYCWSNDWFNF